MIAPRSLSGYLAGLLAASAVTLVSGHARATCTTNADCSHGFECQVVGGSTCAGYACAPDQPCPPPPPCDPVEIRDCVPGGCTVDADCADGMVCFESTSTDCTVTSAPAPSCPPDVKCDPPPPPPPPDCTTHIEHQCVPRYLLPCTQASDCGSGFNCVPDPDACWCSGSSGGGTPGTEPLPPPAPSSSSGGTDPTIPPASTAPVPAPAPTGTPAPPPDCGCTPSTTSHCAPQVTNCTDTSQCPSGWLCKDVSPPTAGACAGYRLPDGGTQTICEPTPPPTPVLQCVPPYADYIGRYYANDSGSGGGTTTGGVPLPPQGQIGVPIDPSVPAPGSGTTNGETSGTPKSGTSPAASSGDTGGCQVGHGGTSAGASLLALFGLIGLTRRRARR